MIDVLFIIFLLKEYVFDNIFGFVVLVIIFLLREYEEKILVVFSYFLRNIE